MPVLDLLSAAVDRLHAAESPSLWFAQRTELQPETLGVLSASFNPMTRAHESMLECAHARFGFDEWLLVLAVANVDKAISGLPLEVRMHALLQWAAERPASIALCSHGRFVDKLTAIRQHYAAARVMFLVGYDTLVRLFDPRYYDDLDAALSTLFADCEFVAFNRADAEVSALQALLTRPDIRPFAGKVHVLALDSELAELSATQVRARLNRGDQIDELVPSAVAHYLRVPPSPDGPPRNRPG